MADSLTGTVIGPFRFCSHGFYVSYELSLASVWNLNRVDQRTPANLQLSLARRPFYMTICFWEILWGRRTEFCADDVRTVCRWSPIQSLHTQSRCFVCVWWWSGLPLSSFGWSVVVWVGKLEHTQLSWFQKQQQERKQPDI